jgi:hypothetical protein
MKRIHALLIALLIGVAALAGTYAATRTAHLGAAAQQQSAAVIKQRERQLARGEAALRKALAQSPAPAPAAARSAAATGAQRVVYVRPAPIVIHKHRAGGEYEAEGRDGGGND